MRRWILEHTFSFDAAHRLVGLPADHPCSKMHGHTWQVTLRLVSRNLVEHANTMMIDFHSLKAWIKPVIDQLDHVILNETVPIHSPTCEMLAEWLFQQMSPILNDKRIRLRLASVKVQETPGNSATYEDD
jgi:6-pyruvoyltetrahydropterin/6-carboxytetrahydropterin synthase